MADFGVTEALEITALAASAVGTGVSAYSQQEQASSAQALAKYNYAAQQQQTQLQAKLAEQQQTWNQQVATSQYQAQQNNATALDQQALAAQAQGRVQAQQMRDNNDRALATLRTKYAASGVVNEGTPLAVLADTAGQLELQVQNADSQTEQQSEDLQQQAAQQRYQSGFSLMDANVAQYHSAVADMDEQSSLDSATANYAAQQDQLNKMSLAPYATLLSGVADAANAARPLTKVPKKTGAIQ